MKTLHLVLKGKWYDLIDCGAKTSEFRACTPYWNRRFCGGKDIFPTERTECHLYDTVVFHRGYTNKTMKFQIDFIRILNSPFNDLHLDKCWEIKLGERIK